ncbi:MAG: exonuclease domain-containing protein [Microscillaceae bacterium]|nr:exonuclease domain-containing protein [Microscillaceae bacterium]
MYAIVDIETTGLRVQEDKITEIAIFIYDGAQIVDSFHSLINPERYLPEYITQLTGINNEMLEDAPKFYEVAKDIVQITEGKVFVAHNAHFDYTFLKNEFKQLGFNFQRKTLCTVRLSRKLFPGLASYSLDKICRHFDISITDRHRAAGDAEATTRLLEVLLQKNEKKLNQSVIDHEINAKTLPPKISREDFNALPEETGVYYFFDEDDTIIYVGKSKNIKKRIAGHFATNLENRKTIEIKNRVARIDFVLTGSELIALLLESDEIKIHQPLFNRAQRRTRFHYGIFTRKSRSGYLQFYVERTKTQTKTAVYVAVSAMAARQVLYNKVKEFQLCQKLCGLYDIGTACFGYQIKECLGACLELESPEDYNVRAEAALDSFNYFARKSFIIITRGRSYDEKGLICVENGRYLGFGYIDETAQISHLEDAKIYIQRYPDNKDIQKILWSWLKNHPGDAKVFKESH